jgi:hypothetical protein
VGIDSVTALEVFVASATGSVGSGAGEGVGDGAGDLLGRFRGGAARRGAAGTGMEVGDLTEEGGERALSGSREVVEVREKAGGAGGSVCGGDTGGADL